ncbi:hexaprenyldihydroxybenzoate methyltransferase mitochondrial precursor [Setomelanomma holmii]|uniref:Ubiquinone biosynthesis O-methyltransferase, mitochondrial n=1 Tax=Setomelanomma holmii TaxID=210430 RepID=A0A9P4H1S1_9PLEO|nr:hexaprenyldihydroxybenzoate methyltransferase mitochondrial precursor [Setomelanomma holmii]
MKPYNPAVAARSVRQCISQTSRRMIQQRNPTIRLAPASSRCFSSTPTTQHNPTTSGGTVDPTEVSHFNALASSWWDPHGPSRLLHLMNPLRHSFIAQCRSSSPSSQKLRCLDVGCGGGIFAESAARLPNTLSVTAVDPTPEVLRIAEGHKRRDPVLMQPGKLTYLNTSIEDLPKPASDTEAYDIVTLFEVLEHVNAPGPFLTHLLPHVKPGGWLILSTIARTWTSWVVTNVVAEDVLGIVPKGTHEWGKYVNEEELRGWFGKQEGWGEVRSLGVVYVPGMGWREVDGGERWGNYFFGVRREV